jgi:hypothetical protein
MTYDPDVCFEQKRTEITENRSAERSTEPTPKGLGCSPLFPPLTPVQLSFWRGMALNRAFSDSAGWLIIDEVGPHSGLLGLALSRRLFLVFAISALL